MFFNHKFICSLLLGLFTLPISSLELIYRKDANLLFENLCSNSCDIDIFFTKEAKNDSIFLPLLNDCKQVGISKCYDTIIIWLKNENILEMNSVRLSKSIEKFLKSNNIITEDEKNALRNLSYLSSIYKSIYTHHCNNKLVRKLRKTDITPPWKKMKIAKEQEVRHNRDLKYNIYENL